MVHNEPFIGKDGVEYGNLVEEPDNPDRFAMVARKGLHCRVNFKHIEFFG